VIDATVGRCLEICGEVIISTGVDDANSALEAICTNVQGVQERQLARQLTAAALNCVITGSGGDCGGAASASLFAGCNQTCETGDPVNGRDVEDCINEIDCLNNGGEFTDGACRIETSGGCHSRDLCNENLGLCFPDPGPATSSKACNDARKSKCEVIETDPKDTGDENDCAKGIQEEEESCAMVDSSQPLISEPAPTRDRVRSKQPKH
jgi:hypothetical protein